MHPQLFPGGGRGPVAMKQVVAGTTPPQTACDRVPASAGEGTCLGGIRTDVFRGLFLSNMHRRRRISCAPAQVGAQDSSAERMCFCLILDSRLRGNTGCVFKRYEPTRRGIRRSADGNQRASRRRFMYRSWGDDRRWERRRTPPGRAKSPYASTQPQAASALHPAPTRSLMKKGRSRHLPEPTKREAGLRRPPDLYSNGGNGSY